jgi:hypothetical protein
MSSENLENPITLVNTATENPTAENATETVSFEGPSKEPKIQLPERYGGDRKGFRTFMQQMDLCFALNPSRYYNDNIKIGTIGTNLKGAASRWFFSLQQAGSGEIVRDYPTFVFFD